MNFKAVIFDFDGVIVDSEVIFVKAMENYMRELGIQAEPGSAVQFTGIPPQSVVPVLKEMTDGRYTDQELWDGIVDMFQNHVRGVLGKPMPGVQEFFDTLKERGIYTALGTSRARFSVQEYIESVGLRMDFDTIVTSEDVSRGKPFPDTFLEAARILSQYGVGKDDIIVIEDSENGIKAAKAAGMYTVAFKGSQVQQNTEGADLECTSYAELASFLF